MNADVVDVMVHDVLLSRTCSLLMGLEDDVFDTLTIFGSAMACDDSTEGQWFWVAGCHFSLRLFYQSKCVQRFPDLDVQPVVSYPLIIRHALFFFTKGKAPSGNCKIPLFFRLNVV